MSRIAPHVKSSLTRQRFWELLGLCGLAITQPLLDLLTRNTSVVSSRGFEPFEMLLVCLAIVIVPAAAAIGLEFVCGLASSRLAEVMHSVLVAALLALLLMQLLKHNTTMAPWVFFCVAMPIAVVGALLAARLESLRSGMRFLAFAQILFVVLALGFSPLTNVVFSGDVSAIRTTIERPRRVVMLVLDEFPTASLLRSDGSGLIDDDLFPNFSALASTSHWYRNHTTVSPLTSDAVPAMLSGEYPEASQTPPTVANHPNNLFTALGNTYSLNVHEAVTVVCVLPQCERSATTKNRGSSVRRVGGALRESVELWWSFAKPQRESSEVDFTALVDKAKDRPIESVRRFIESIEPSSTPRLDFLHVLLPHAPWQYLKDGSATNASGRSPGWEGVWRSEWAGLSGYQRHLMQLQATDMLLGQLIDRLRAVEAFDDSLIVVTGDHGVGFDNGEPNRGISKKNAANIAWTPLFIKYPNGDAGVVDDRPAQSIDVLPTMAESLGVELPWDMDGRSLLGAPAADAPRRLWDFKLNKWHPVSGKKYIELDPARFAEVLDGAPNGEIGDPLRLFRMVPRSEIVGLRYADLASGPPASFTATIKDSSQYSRIVLNTGSVPWADIAGVTSGVTANSYLAIVVNGIVSAVVPVSPNAPNSNSAKWWGRLLPDAMRDGVNQIELFEARMVDGRPQLGIVTSS